MSQPYILRMQNVSKANLLVKKCTGFTEKNFVVEGEQKLLAILWETLQIFALIIFNYPLLEISLSVIWVGINVQALYF